MSYALDYSAFWDHQDTDYENYKYLSSDFNTAMKAIAGDGIIYGYGNNFSCTRWDDGGVHKATINSGACFIDGHYGRNSSSTTFVIPDDTVYYIYIEVDETNRVIQMNAGTSVPTGAFKLWRVRYYSQYSTWTYTDYRTYSWTLYNTANPGAKIFAQSTTPPLIQGAVWIKTDS